MSTTRGADEVKQAIFFEKQFGMLCAQHALNMLLQGPYFSAVDLADIARDLDRHEKEILSPAERARWQSNNLDDSGYFSLQVITIALKKSFDVLLVPFGSPSIAEYQSCPENAQAFICHQNQHWFTLRRFGKQWYNLNSMQNAPKPISNSYLSIYIKQLQTEGINKDGRSYSIYYVHGFLPESTADQLARQHDAIAASAAESAQQYAPSTVAPADRLRAQRALFLSRFD